MKIKEADNILFKTLTTQHSVGEARSIIRIIFEDAFDIYNPQKAGELTVAQIAHFQEINRRLAAGEPVQYILGEADFFGLKFNVNPAVLIPRPETEELVFWIEETANAHPHLRSVLDIGTGSGCIPITLKKRLPRLDISALDVSEKALQTARENAEKNAVAVDFILQDILNEKGWGSLPTCDIIVSNPPYIPTREKTLMPSHVLEHEPHLALFTTDENPLIFYKKITAFARQKLSKSGFLFFECNEYNAEEVAAHVRANGFDYVKIKEDMQGKKRMIAAGF